MEKNNKHWIYNMQPNKILGGKIQARERHKVILVMSHLRNWVFATNSNFLISLSLRPEGYFKIGLFDLT